MSKSTWMGVTLRTKRNKASVMSWFGIMGEDMMPEKAEILCDNETDREKKIRVFVVDAKGNRFKLERTLGGRNCIVSRMRLPMVAPDETGIGAHRPVRR